MNFQAHLRAIPNAKVLELGTKRSRPNFPTHHKSWAPEAKWVMSDFQEGLDVDVIADAHKLTETFEPESFDAVVACSVFEHLQRPWIAAKEIAGVLKPGGMVFVQTHQTFVLHGYPNDYWRFTKEALQTIFEDAGLKTISSDYSFPCRIFSINQWRMGLAPRLRSYLNVSIVAKKDQS
jgi:predicted SAM-dependent methyltransferase